MTSPKAYVFREPVMAWRAPYRIDSWAEVDDASPVHPAELLERLKWLVGRGSTWGTCSALVVTMVGYLIRKGEVPMPFSFYYVDADGVETELPVDDKGRLVLPWPESGFDSIQEANFYYTFAEDMA